MGKSTKYQYQVDNRPAGPIRDKWDDAVQDAVNDGMAVWVDADKVRLDSTHGASIARVE